MLEVGGGISFGAGISVTGGPPNLMLSLDAVTYDNTTTGTQQNVSGTSDNIGFFPYGWPAYNVIQIGWTCVQTGAVVTVVDAVNHIITTVGTPFTSGDSYTFTGANSWIDSVGNLPFILYNGVTLSGDGGNSMSFTTSSGQYAQSSTSLADLSKWTVEAWHYYDGTNTGASPCIVTEVYPGSTGDINYFMGALDSSTTNLEAGYFNGGFQITPAGYTLTSGNWYQIVGTYDGTQVKLYVNNILVGQATASGNQPISSQGGINLMRRWDNAEYWGGKLAIVKIYDGDIGQGGVTASWNANKSRFGLGQFTVSSGDITYNQQLYGGYSSYSSAGFTCDSDRDTYNGIIYTTTSGLHSSIVSTWTAAGFNTANAYVWQVEFATGGSILARVAVNPDGITNTLAITPIDQTDTRWQSGFLGGPTLAGTYTFPAVFTSYAPTTQMSTASDWC